MDKLLKVALLLLLSFLLLLGLLLYWLECYRQIIGQNLIDFYTNSWLAHLINFWIQQHSLTLAEPFPSLAVHFPQHLVLKKKWKTIKKEALNLYKKGYTKPINQDVFFTEIASPTWKRFYLKWYGPCLEDAKQLCPKTCKLIESMPEIKLAMFSILEPGSKILPHHGPFKACLRYHLGLKTPNSENCFIMVNREKYSWRDQEDVLFDDTYLHYVENNTDKLRVILFCDVERKMNSVQNQQTVDWLCDYFGSQYSRTNDVNEVQVH